jgi:hypothetical protein
MPRKHTFMIVVLLAAAFAAGAFALTRTTDVGSSASASTSPDAAIAFRLKKLDRFEAALQRQLLERATSRATGQITVYRRASTSPTSTYQESEDGYESDNSEDEGRDD